MRQQQSIYRARMSAIAAAVVLFSVSAFGQTGQSRASSTAPAAVQGGDTLRRLTVDDAVKIALEQNLGIQIQRVEPQIQDETVAQARAAWLPNLTSSFNKNSNTFQSTNSLSGSSPTVNNALFSGGAGINQVLPWGGSYTASWGSSHSTTTDLSRTFNPVLNSQLAGNYRHFRRDPARDDRADVAQREERVLGSRLSDRQPEGGAAVAAARAAVAQGQHAARRNRHDGADRHRRREGRGRAQRGSGDSRAGSDRGGAGQPEDADLRSVDAGLLVDEDRSGRHRAVPGPEDRRGRGRSQRARQTRGSAPGEAEHRAERHQHPVFSQSDSAGHQRPGELPGNRRGRRAVAVGEHLRSRGARQQADRGRA